MSRNLAYRPRHHLSRINPQPLRHSHPDYLRQRWTYRQQRATYIKHPLGYGLSLVPWGWRLSRESARLRA